MTATAPCRHGSTLITIELIDDRSGKGDVNGTNVQSVSKEIVEDRGMTQDR